MHYARGPLPEVSLAIRWDKELVLILARLSRTVSRLSSRLQSVAPTAVPPDPPKVVPAKVFTWSEFALERLIEDGGQQGVEFGGGLGLEALQVVHVRL